MPRPRRTRRVRVAIALLNVIVGRGAREPGSGRVCAGATWPGSGRLVDRLVLRVDEKLRARLRRTEILPVAHEAAAGAHRLPVNLEPPDLERHDTTPAAEEVGWVLSA